MPLVCKLLQDGYVDVDFGYNRCGLNQEWAKTIPGFKKSNSRNQSFKKAASLLWERKKNKWRYGNTSKKTTALFLKHPSSILSVVLSTMICLPWFKKTNSPEKSHKFYLQPFDARFLRSQRFGIKDGWRLSRSSLFIQFVALKAGGEKNAANIRNI